MTASVLQVRVLKAAHTKDPNTPCLRYTVAQAGGLVWGRKCGPTDTPNIRHQDADGEFWVTDWVNLDIEVVGQRGQDVLLLLEAEPQGVDVKDGTDPVFVVDAIRVVGADEDPKVWVRPPTIVPSGSDTTKSHR